MHADLVRTSSFQTQPQPREHPLKSLLAGFRFLLASPLVGGIALLAGLLTLAAVAVIGSLIIFTLRVNRTVAQTDVAHH